ncbi:Transcriptional regulatory protein ResD [Petrocella atlantisensis]|uniref:Stage 0 sporulation protein A homolog n=1 Tax=Petrocella atlantisensis TaxID=2173034 RepID=A0A3P7S040_9FIRM|nr:response regulator transcription factor [Petrocella atlantisensis]MCF8020582.1 response regulator transcription factor [Vallitaleaceae bacterium]PKM54744.1 MAG: DNA-binding response regulator [Firmicutes bacterium HGW-Firmicutes-5]VDN48256.1 Transcriptional regulatory protein ResD [Petrocella atlantisensis]
MEAKSKILIVDDDENITELIALYLEKEGYSTKSVHNGNDAIHVFKAFAPNLVILDLMLPGKDGFDVCKDIRQVSNTPIIMLTAKGETFDKILGLELGADDYMIKPFDTKELTARVKAVLRRFTPKGNATKQIAMPNLTINLSNYTVVYNDTKIEMPPKELELIYFLASNPNQVFTREQLLDRIWGYEYIGDTRTVDVHIKRIREKINESDAWGIKTVWGIGYKFEVN